MDLLIRGGEISFNGEIAVPGDKSISHRAAIIGAIAEGKTEIFNFSESKDCLTTLKCLKELGIKVKGPDDSGHVTICGRGLYGLNEPDNILDAENSGTTTRLLMGILAGQEFFTAITGDGSLRNRPMERVAVPLKQMGAVIDGRSNACRLPVSIRGRKKLKPVHYKLPIPSAQVKSALLLAGLFAEGQTVVREELKSRDHTERMLKYFGADIKKNIVNNGKEEITIIGSQSLQARAVEVPGDLSAASFFMVGAAITPKSDLLIRGVGINPTRTGIIDVLRQMGAGILVLNEREISGEPTADLKVQYSELRAVSIDGKLIPRLIDEIPILAVAAAFAKGVTVIKEAAELRVKETDRIHAVVTELKKLGAEIEEKEDGFVIEGGKPLHGNVCSSYGDHRLAMSIAIAALAGKDETIVKGAECIDVSFPGFINVLKALREE